MSSEFGQPLWRGFEKWSPKNGWIRFLELCLPSNKLKICTQFLHPFAIWTRTMRIYCMIKATLNALELFDLLKRTLKSSWKGFLPNQIHVVRKRKKWNFVTKIVLTYCEKKLFKGSRKTFEIRGWRPRICKIFEITRAIYSNSERSKQFLVTECIFNLFLEVSQIHIRN